MQIGGEEFIPLAVAMAERCTGKESVEHCRSQDKYFEPLEKVIREFEMKHQIKIEGLNIQSYSGKKMRAELLVHLKERAGITYRGIAQLDLFADLELSSLGCIYRRALSNRPE